MACDAGTRRYDNPGKLPKILVSGFVVTGYASPALCGVYIGTCVWTVKLMVCKEIHSTGPSWRRYAPNPAPLLTIACVPC